VILSRNIYGYDRLIKWKSRQMHKPSSPVFFIFIYRTDHPPYRGHPLVIHPQYNPDRLGWSTRNHLKKLLIAVKLPNLKNYPGRDSGRHWYITSDGYQSRMTQILTGYNPEITGVFSNGNYQPIPKDHGFERWKKLRPDHFVTVRHREKGTMWIMTDRRKSIFLKSNRKGQ